MNAHFIEDTNYLVQRLDMLFTHLTELDINPRQKNRIPQEEPDSKPKLIEPYPYCLRQNHQQILEIQTFEFQNIPSILEFYPFYFPVDVSDSKNM